MNLNCIMLNERKLKSNGCPGLGGLVVEGAGYKGAWVNLRKVLETVSIYLDCGGGSTLAYVFIKTSRTAHSKG